MEGTKIGAVNRSRPLLVRLFFIHLRLCITFGQTTPVAPFLQRIFVG